MRAIHLFAIFSLICASAYGACLRRDIFGMCFERRVFPENREMLILSGRQLASEDDGIHKLRTQRALTSPIVLGYGLRPYYPTFVPVR